ncbi:MAG TPA: hypothetical protein PLJ54_06810 [Rhodoglobus sp.]|nr:hypothetical protein [Rhodoglobus sp.]
MAVMRVGVVLVCVGQCIVGVHMPVTDARLNRRVVLVLVVLIVRVPVVVRDGEVGVLVHVPLREVQPYSQGHEGGSDDQRHGH